MPWGVSPLTIESSTSDSANKLQFLERPAGRCGCVPCRALSLQCWPPTDTRTGGGRGGLENRVYAEAANSPGDTAPALHEDLGGKLLRHVHCVHACRHACLHTHSHVGIHACTRTCMHAHMHTCIPAHLHTCIPADLQTCIHAYAHTRIHAYVHTCIHACMHAYVQSRVQVHMHTSMHPREQHIHPRVCTRTCIWARVRDQSSYRAHETHQALLLAPLPRAQDMKEQVYRALLQKDGDTFGAAGGLLVPVRDEASRAPLCRQRLIVRSESRICILKPRKALVETSIKPARSPC